MSTSNEDVQAAPLARLSAAARMLAEAKTLDEIKQVHDIATAAATYARAAKIGLEAQNHAAEIKLSCERRAGELLRQLEREQGGNGRFGSSDAGQTVSEYTVVLTDTGTSRQDASRWQRIADMPEPAFVEYIAETKAAGKELTTTGALRIAKECDREVVRETNRALVNETPPVITMATDTTYQTIVLDPPWDWGDEGDCDQYGRARPTYATMSIDEIAELPISELAHKDAHIYLWITNRSLPKGFALLDGWGFRYITALTWVKPSFGMGNYFRGSTEHVLFGVRGSLPLLRNDMPTHFNANRPGIHSGKPDEFYAIVESCSPGPWLELFSRKPRNGWIAWGADANDH